MLQTSPEVEFTLAQQTNYYKIRTNKLATRRNLIQHLCEESSDLRVSEQSTPSVYIKTTSRENTAGARGKHYRNERLREALLPSS